LGATDAWAERCKFSVRGYLGFGAVALFVFLSGAAWAGVVAANLFAGAAGCGAVAVG
jgi:hypothetical protein